MNAIFLDLDGVLNTAESLEISTEHEPKFYKPAVRYLMRLINMFDLKIVLTSSWRLNFGMEHLEEIFEDNGIPRKLLISKTLVGSSRGAEIKHWLKMYNVRKWIMLDDDPENIVGLDKEHVVFIKDGFDKKGFDERHFEEAVKKLRVQ